MNVETNQIISLINHCLYQQLAQNSWNWFEQKRQQIVNRASKKELFLAFSTASRHITNDDLIFLPQDSYQITHWCPSHWTHLQATRTLLILSFPHNNPDDYLNMLEQLYTTADLEELVTLYSALPLLPYPEQLRLRAAEGVRSNMTAVFNAVALQNPYPAKYFDDLAWNQMVLKALFVGSSLDLIQGLETRANPILVQMLLDYAHERQSAQRSIPPQLWQLVTVNR